MRTLAWMVCVMMACDAGEKPAGPAATPKRPEVTVSRTDLPDLAYLPADSDLVIAIDVAKLRRGTLWKTYEPDVTKLLVPGFAGCEYAPLADVTTVSMGLPLKSELGVFVIRGVDRDKTLACLRTSKAESPTTATFDGDVVTLTNKSGAVNVLAFVDARTMVMQGSKQPTKDTLRKTLQIGAPLASDAAFVTALKNVRSKAAITIVSRPGSEQLGEKWRQIGAHVKQLSGSADLTDRLDMRFVIVLASADEAKTLAATMDSQLRSLQSMADKAEARAQGDAITVELGMNQTQLESMVQMIRGMMPAQ